MILFALCSLTAQKKALDHSVYDTWKSVGTATMTQDGKYSLTTVSAQAADGYLVQSNLLNGSSFIIDRGKTPAFTFDSKYAVCAIAPLYNDSRQAKIDKKKPEESPKDTLCIWTLGSTALTKYPFVTSFKSAEEGKLAVAFKTDPPADTSNTKRAPKKEKGEGTDLMLHYFATG